MVVAGCGNPYRPVVTPIVPTGPASQPENFVVVITSPGSTSPGLVNIFDAAGDALLSQAALGNGPLALTVNAAGSQGTSANLDGTVNSFPITTALQTKNVQSSTLLSPAQPVNLLATTTNLYIIEPNVPATAVLTGNPFQLTQNIPLASSPINFAGNTGSVRIYAISQGNTAQSVAFGACEHPGQVTVNGEVAGIETATNTVSARLPVGICPVYGVTSSDNNRTFILNRGSGTVTVVNSQQNQIDAAHPAFTVGAGPVYADYYNTAAQLVTANYDGDSISIINVSLDSFGNDSPQFGQTVTVPVGAGPAAVTVLRDGSRAYVANQLDGTVSVVDLSSYKVKATIPVSGHPLSIASIYSTPTGRVYVISPDSAFMTVIRTDTDQVEASIQLNGNGVEVHSTTQVAGATGSPNAVITSHASGSGAPCGLGARCYTTQ